MISDEQLDIWFTYHPPTPAQQQSYVRLRDAARSFAQVIRDETPAGADQTAAIRKLRECVMTANAAIACHVEPNVEPGRYRAYKIDEEKI